MAQAPGEASLNWVSDPPRERPPMTHITNSGMAPPHQSLLRLRTPHSAEGQTPFSAQAPPMQAPQTASILARSGYAEGNP